MTTENSNVVQTTDGAVTVQLSDNPLASFSFALRNNNTCCREQCPICGQTFKPDIGWWPFLGDRDDADGIRPVCLECCFKHTEPWEHELFNVIASGRAGP